MTKENHVANHGQTITAEGELAPGLTLRVELVDAGAVDHLDLAPVTAENPLAMMPLANLFGAAHAKAALLIGEAFERWRDDSRAAARRIVRSDEEVAA